MTTGRHSYPWSAVVGQDPLKLALLLCAIDPTIGGVLIEGPRGTAKTTLARALSEIVLGTFVELPLGATEERVTGTLDLEAALREQRVSFAPGLLARAHEGVLYVDEVNLLSDALVDLLLDAAGSGMNVVERDAVSHAHAARFVLVGTMNPEEGELRPQLLDRFGLCVRGSEPLLSPERAEIVRRRLDFDRDPQSFRQQYEPAQAALVARCTQARSRLQELALSADVLTQVSERCHAANVEGVRADLALLRAARAHAAWHGRTEIEASDVDAVAELALVHRRGKARAPAPPPRGSGGGGRSGGGSGSGPSQDPSSSSSRSGSTSASAQEGTSAGALSPVPVRAVAPTRLPGDLDALRSFRPARQARGKAQLRAAAGARARGRAEHGAIDWFATLVQRARPDRTQLRYRARRAPSSQLWILVLDCSASMLRSGALAQAKGCAQAFEARAARAGAHVAVLSFQGTDARVEVSSRAGRSVLAQSIAALGGGGGTPLRRALDEVQQLCASPTWRSRTITKRAVLFTDGRTRESVADAVFVRPELEWLVIDCERGPVRLGRAAQLAAAVNGSCYDLQTLM